MNRLFVISVLTVAACAGLLLTLLPVPSAARGATDAGSNQALATDASTLFIDNVYLTDRDGVRTAGDLWLADGQIKKMGATLVPPPGVRIIDGVNLTAVPGLIDSHTHSYGTALPDALRFGISVQLDMNSPTNALAPARAQRTSRAPVDQSDLFSSGMLATVEGGHGTQFGLPMETLATPDEAADWVRRRKAEGSDYIKLVYMPSQQRFPSLDRATCKALIDAAHAEGLLALAHISSQRGAIHMTEDGIDGLVHIFADEAVSDNFIQLAIDRDLFVIPTLAVIASVAAEPNPLARLDEVQKWLSPMQKQTLGASFGTDRDEALMERALLNVRKLYEAGVPILAGSDAPNPGTAYGYSLHYELELLVRAGLSHDDAFRAATEVPARHFGLTGRGVLEEGARADVLLVQGNPYQSVRSSRQIKHLIKNGVEIERQAATPDVAPALASAVLGTFDDDVGGPGALTWTATDDSIMGGDSVATIERIERAGGGHALAVTARIGAGFPWPWAGAGLGTGNPSDAANVSDYSSIVFDVKGTPGTYRLMMFSGMGAGEPPTQTFAVSADWTTVRIPLTRFTGFDPEAFTMLSIVAGASAQAAEFVIDEVRFEK